MSTIFIWVIASALLIAILLSTPLVKHIVSPIFQGVVSTLGGALKLTSGYIVWVGKSIVSAHMIVFQHLLHGKAYFDPTAEVRDKE